MMASNDEVVKDKGIIHNKLSNMEDDIFAIRSNKMTVQSLENKDLANIEKNNILLRQSTILSYFKPIKRSKNMGIGRKINDQNEILFSEPNENDNENKASTSSLTLITQQQSITNATSKREFKSIQSMSNEEPLIKKKLLDITLTEKEKKVLNHIKFEAKIGLYRNFDEIPLPEIYIQEKNKITLDEYIKKQLKTFLNNKSYDPMDDIAANTDFLLEEETDETFSDLFIPVDEAIPETPFGDSQYILDIVQNKYLKKK